MAMGRKKDFGSIDKGLAVNNVILETNKYVLGKKKYIKFEKDKVADYIDKFEELKELGIISGSCTFESGSWFGLGNYNNKHFKFDIFEFNKDLINALKCFVIIQLLDIGLTIEVLSLRYSEISRAIICYDYFREEMIYEFEEFVLNKMRVLKEFIHGLRSFFNYFSINDSDSFSEILLYARYNEEGYSREIPNYNSVVWFDYLVKRFEFEISGKLKRKYYPIILWWKITSIIPMRPIEFINLEANCVEFEKDGIYKLRVSRKKRKKSFYRKKRLELVDELSTNKELFDIITDYLEEMDINKDEKLLSLKAYSEFYETKNRIIKNRISYNDLRILLKSFYNEIISSYFGYNVFDEIEDLENSSDLDGIVRLRLGDTRHMAFCSMMLQGINPLVIAQMGGHTQLETQMHYGVYLNEYLDSYTRMLVKVLKEERLSCKNSLNEKYSIKDKIKFMYRHHGKTPVRKIDGVDCYSSNFPYECFEVSCSDCDHHGLDYDKVDANILNELNTKYDESKLDVISKVEYLKKYYTEILKDGSINLMNLTCSSSVEGDLKRLSFDIKDSAQKEAKILAKMELIANEYINKMEKK